MSTYSTTVVIDSLLKPAEIENTVEKIQRNIKNNGGEILEVDKWGKKRLAYEIKKRQYGYYVDIIFQASGNLVKVIEREYGLDENILRYLTIVLNKKALKYREEQQKELEKDTLSIDESSKNSEFDVENNIEDLNSEEILTVSESEIEPDDQGPKVN